MEIDELAVLWAARFLVVAGVFLVVHLVIAVVRDFRGPRDE
jgi:hypothetical protein